MVNIKTKLTAPVIMLSLILAACTGCATLWSPAKIAYGYRQGVIVDSPDENIKLKDFAPLLVGFIHHRDGHLMVFRSDWTVRHSLDGGLTWSDIESLHVPEKVGVIRCVIRQKDGKLGLLAMYHNWFDHYQNRNFFVNHLNWYVSSDEGKTWSEPVRMNPSGLLGLPLHDTAIQTGSGRIIVPVATSSGGHRGMNDETGAYGIVKGKKNKKKIEDHGHVPEMAEAFVYYSDDEGKTWSRSEREIFIWKDKGYGGIWVMTEPNVVELKDGRLLMFARTALGRIYQVASNDRGNRWGYPEPTELASSLSPCRLRRIPKTGDLICVWNQVSANEIRGGFWRSRLSVAISGDEGKTWKNFKTVATAGLLPVGRIRPVKPRKIQARDDVGTLPESYGRVAYPNIAFHEDTVLLNWRHGPMLILPLKWFYDD